MAHSNSTTNYSLPQFVSTDKPAWLTDVNTAYSDIDTGMHNAQVAADAAQADATQALTTAGEASTAAAAADAKASGSVASIASAYDTTATYDVGDVVLYNSLLYICTVAVVNPGPWSGSANWARITIDELIDDKTATKQTLTNDLNAGTVSENSYIPAYENGANIKVNALDLAKLPIKYETITGVTNQFGLISYDHLHKVVIASLTSDNRIAFQLSSFLAIKNYADMTAAANAQVSIGVWYIER